MVKSRPVSFAVVLLACAAWSAPATLSAASVARQIEQIFEPERVVGAALAPDGRHVAFAMRDARGVELMIWNVASSESPGRARLDPRAGAALTFLGWSSARRLIAVPNAPLVVAVDLRGRNARPVVDEKSLAATAGGRRSGHAALRVLRLLRDRGIITLEVRWSSGGGGEVLDVVAVNLESGEHQLVHTRRGNGPGGVFLADRDGRPRLWLDRGGETSRYLYLPADGERRDWEPLDRMIGSRGEDWFAITPENFLGERAIPLGFGADPNRLFIASNVGRERFGLEVVDLDAGAREVPDLGRWEADLVDSGDAFPEEALVRDPATGEVVGVHGSGPDDRSAWWDTGLGAAQEIVNQKFPGRRVRLAAWDDSREIFLLRVAAAHDPGRWFVFHRGDGRCVEYVRDGALEAAETNPVEAFALESPDGGRLTGTLTRPQVDSGSPPPLIVWLHDGPWLRVPPGFRREAQALAAMGFAVLEVNHRGTNGFGRSHVTAMQEAYDRVPLEDVLAAVAWGRERAAFDPARVAVAGRGVGGYLALRALQLRPEVFRAGAALNAPMDLGRLYQPERDIEASQRAAEQSLRASAAADRGLPAPASDGSGDAGASGGAGAPASIPLGPGGGGASPPGFGGGGRGPTFERERARRFFGAAGRQRIGVDDHLDALTQPVFLAHDPALPVPAMAGVARLRDALVRRRQVVEWMELTPAYSRGDLKARAEVVRRLGEFLQNHVGGAATEGGR